MDSGMNLQLATWDWTRGFVCSIADYPLCQCSPYLFSSPSPTVLFSPSIPINCFSSSLYVLCYHACFLSHTLLPPFSFVSPEGGCYFQIVLERGSHMPPWWLKHMTLPVQQFSSNSSFSPVLWSQATNPDDERNSRGVLGPKWKMFYFHNFSISDNIINLTWHDVHNRMSI